MAPAATDGDSLLPEPPDPPDPLSLLSSFVKAILSKPTSHLSFISAFQPLASSALDLDLGSIASSSVSSGDTLVASLRNLTAVCSVLRHWICSLHDGAQAEPRSVIFLKLTNFFMSLSRHIDSNCRGLSSKRGLVWIQSLVDFSIRAVSPRRFVTLASFFYQNLMWIWILFNQSPLPHPPEPPDPPDPPDLPPPLKKRLGLYLVSAPLVYYCAIDPSSPPLGFVSPDWRVYPASLEVCSLPFTTTDCYCVEAHSPLSLGLISPDRKSPPMFSEAYLIPITAIYVTSPTPSLLQVVSSSPSVSPELDLYQLREEFVELGLKVKVSRLYLMDSMVGVPSVLRALSSPQVCSSPSPCDFPIVECQMWCELVALVGDIGSIIVPFCGSSNALERCITALCRPLTAVCRSLFKVFMFSSILWQRESRQRDSSFPPVIRVLMDRIFPVSSLLEFVSLPFLSFVLSGLVAGGSPLKITDTSVSGLSKGSSKWCLITSDFVAVYMIVNCAFIAVSISGGRSLNMVSNSQGFASHCSSIGVEFRGLLHDISSSSVMFAAIYLCRSSFLKCSCWLFCRYGLFITLCELLLLYGD